MPARKRFGQHWLRSEAILDRIVAAAELRPSDRVLEIGPGRGALTQRLLAAVDGLVAVELDRDLIDQLQQRFGQAENFCLLEGDILQLDWTAAIADRPRFANPSKVVANIPYNITGPILQSLLGTIAQPRRPAFERLVLLVQQEVADRLCATPGQRAYGALSVRVQYLASCERVCAVPPKSFSPPPKVQSTVICLKPRPWPQVCNNPGRLEKLLNQGFSAKRKMLRNNLKSLYSSEQIEAAFAAHQIAPEARAETLSIDQWIGLCTDLGDPTDSAINPTA